MGGSMSSVIITGDTSGAITLAAPSVAGTNTITLPASTGTAVLADGSGNISTTGTVTGTKIIPTGTSVSGNGMYLPASNTLAFSTNGVESTRINSTGSLLVNYSGASQLTDPQGISISSPVNTALQLYLLKATQVEAHFGFKSSSDSNLYVGTAGGITGIGTYGTYQGNTATSWSSVSDETLKTNLTPILDGLNKVASLRAVTGRYKTDPEDKSRSFLIAQDVQKVLPEAVSIADPETGTLGLGYTDVIPLLVAAIKELKAEIDTLKAGK